MTKQEKEFEELKERQCNYKNNGGTFYFHSKEEFDELLLLMQEISKKADKNFFDDRLLVIGTTVEPLTDKEGNDYNRWETMYRPDGMDGEHSFLTTDSNGKLVNMVGLELSNSIGISERLLELIESGELEATDSEKEFVVSSIKEVGYKENVNEKTKYL